MLFLGTARLANSLKHIISNVGKILLCPNNDKRIPHESIQNSLLVFTKIGFSEPWLFHSHPHLWRWVVGLSLAWGKVYFQQLTCFFNLIQRRSVLLQLLLDQQGVECPTRALKTWKLEPELEISSSSQVKFNHYQFQVFKFKTWRTQKFQVKSSLKSYKLELEIHKN